MQSLACEEVADGDDLCIARDFTRLIQSSLTTHLATFLGKILDYDTKLNQNYRTLQGRGTLVDFKLSYDSKQSTGN